MALAWAQAQSKAKEGVEEPAGPSVLRALLTSDDKRGEDASAALCASSTAKKEEELAPDSYVVVFTQVLPDGMGDLIFGENAVLELLEEAPVAWLRHYTNEESMPQGERLIEETRLKACRSLVTSNLRGFEESGSADLERLWHRARERFLAPWIFGLSAEEEGLLRLARSSGRPFWALTEYGRSMGPIAAYTSGLGTMLPTGWAFNGDPRAGGVFRSLWRSPRTGTNWRRHLAGVCGLPEDCALRIWWFYSRKGDEAKHSFRVLEQGKDRLALAKAMPVDARGEILRVNGKTSGEKLAEQLFQVASDPGFTPNVDVACAEVTAGGAAELSQFLWGVLNTDAFLAGSKVRGDNPVDVVVAPNILTSERTAGGSDHLVAEVLQLDLIEPSRVRREVALPAGRRLLICSTRIPRTEMRTFLEECEDPVFTTGDQSLAEAIFLGKIPCIRPDAKVGQWQEALRAQVSKSIEEVPDLGKTLRSMVTSADARNTARQESKRRSDALERQLTIKLGARPEEWTATQHVLARAGMLG